MERHMNEAPVPMRSLNPEVNEQLQAVVMQALAKDRDRRFAGCADLANALAAAAPVSSGGSSKPVDNVLRFLKAAVAVLALTTLVAVGGWMAGSGEKDPGDSTGPLRKELSDTVAAKEKVEQELQSVRAQLSARGASDDATLVEAQKKLQAAQASLEKSQQDAAYWKDQAAKERAAAAQTGDIRVVKLQKDLQAASAARDSAERETNHWKDQAAKLERELRATKKTAPPVVKPAREIAKYLSLARKYRESGAYDNALSQLSAARALDPGNEEIAEEFEKTRRACNAEKRLGRSDLKC
jgi:tetratricopeptide (TPR) repeat protein